MFGQIMKSQKTNVMQLNGIGRANYKNILYEGQLVNDMWDGFGRAIYNDGRYHIGFWKNDMRNGYGRSVKKEKGSGKDTVEEGFW